MYVAESSLSSEYPRRVDYLAFPEAHGYELKRKCRARAGTEFEEQRLVIAQSEG